MKKGIILLLAALDLLLLGVVNNYLMVNDSYKSNIETNFSNKYYKEEIISYVQNSNKKVAENKQDLLNIFYSMLNNGYESYNFKCSNSYLTCSQDLINIFNDQLTLIYINNLVNPYNSYKDINLTYSSVTKEFTINIEKLYTEEEITEINTKIDEVTKDLFKQNTNTFEAIQKIHNYIINNTNYSSNKKYKYSSAYGALIQKHAICGGYADAMALFLDKIGIPNIKIINSTHVWNAVYINGRWLYIDTTWDDNGNKELSYNYYLVDANTLESYNSYKHYFSKNIYSELL